MRSFAIRGAYRHAGALALVGWYLMVPPAHRERVGGPITVESDAPLSRWEPCDLGNRLEGLGQNCQASYDTASGCEKGRAELLERRDNSLNSKYPDKYGNIASLIKQAVNTQCPDYGAYDRG
jgi:hypothetical protein